MCTVELPTCGNGSLDPGEQCDAGPANADAPALEVSQPGGIVFTSGLVERFTEARFFYGLVSASAHTGYEDRLTSNLFLYRDYNTRLVSLFTVHGIDLDTTGVMQPLSDVSFEYTGVPGGTSVVISDDAGELNAAGAGRFVGNWRFQNNTDGGVLQGLPIPGNWIVRVHPTWRQGLTTWRWVDQDNLFTTFDRTRDVLIQARSTPSMCRTTCTIPRCGDGIWDAGEACDDGNTIPNDGCAPDCRSVP